MKNFSKKLSVARVKRIIFDVSIKNINIHSAKLSQKIYAKSMRKIKTFEFLKLLKETFQTSNESLMEIEI